MSKSAAVIFARELVEGSWNWGEQALPRLSKYYLGLLQMVHGTSM